MSLIDEQLLKLTAAVGRLEGKLDNIERSVTGNGQPGLMQRVEDLEGSRKAVWGGFAVLTAIGGFLEWLMHRH